MKDDDFKLLRGSCDGQTNEQTDICECRVAFATENAYSVFSSFTMSLFVLTLPGT